MLTFLHPALLWGLTLVGVPVLIHLINMFRHRRVSWAAMEFLLESQRRSRRWIILRQLLLLLLRMLAVAAVVLIVARPRISDRLGAVLGSGKVHHVVLLDDSFSMSDRRGETSALDRAKAAVQRIASAAVEGEAMSAFTLLRFSKAAQRSGATPDFLEETVDAGFGTRLTERLKQIEATKLDVGPADAMAAINDLLDPPDDESRVVYILSDFRRRQWSDAESLRGALKKLASESVQVHLVACVERQNANLAVTGLAPLPSVRVAGVPMFIEVSVRNFGRETARNVVVALEEDGHPRPSVLIETIEPGEQQSRRFSVSFPTAGQHELVARLPDDAVAADNARYAVVDVDTSVPVLLVDGGATTNDARFLATALAPGGIGRTGVVPEIVSPAALGRQPLERFHAIFICNVAGLSPTAIEALESYLSAGGGVAFFLGPLTQPARYNEQLYRDGQGLFPVPLGAAVDLFVDRLEKTPDIEPADHPVFRVFQGQRNDFLRAVAVGRYFSVPGGWKPTPEVRVIARLRNGAPLAVEKRRGDGRVVAFLTTAAPTWNNWSRNPSFVVAMLELNSYLATAGDAPASYRVGQPLELLLEAASYEPHVRFEYRNGETRKTTSVDANAIDRATLQATLSETPEPGIYVARLVRSDAQPEVRSFAFNVVADEGDMAFLDRQQLSAELDGVPYEYHRADDPGLLEQELSGAELGPLLVVLLVLALLGEQALAYVASYHLPAQGGQR